MKRGSEYAKRIKRLFRDLVRKSGKKDPAEPTDPLEQLIVGILADCTSRAKAQAVCSKLQEQMVDLNELRVTPPSELAETIGNSVPLAGKKALCIVEALNDIRRRQETMDLSFLASRGRREAREYLESLNGVPRGAAASVILYSLGGHAIPIDDLTLYVLRKEELIDESADIVEAQGFLERHISAANARQFSDLLNRYVTDHGSRVPVDKLGELLNPPPPEPAASSAVTGKKKKRKESSGDGSTSKSMTRDKKSTSEAKPAKKKPSKGTKPAKAASSVAKKPTTKKRMLKKGISKKK